MVKAPSALPPAAAVEDPNVVITPMNPAPPAQVAVMDLGSNSVRLVIAQVLPGLPPRVVSEEREPVRLGESVFHTGMLNHAAAERTLVALKRFAAVIRARKVGRVHARGTCALREAEDRQAFLERVKQETGIDVQVLTGAEEGRLIARGVLSAVANPAGEIVVVDVGGGSMEVIRAVDGAVTNVASLKLGAVRLSEMFLRSDPPAAAEVELLRQHARTLLKNMVGFTGGAHPRVMVSAGTANTLLALCRSGKGNGPHIKVTELEQTVVQLGKLTMAKRRQVPQLEAKRADIIVAGGWSLLEALWHVGAHEVEVTRRGLKEGLLLDAVESMGVALPNATEPERVRTEGAWMVARRYAADENHATQVAALACGLFEGTRALHGLPEDARSELEAASLLHDIGQLVSFEKHQRHGAYLVAHSNLPGFSDLARLRLAAVVRYHRKRGPHGDDPEWQELGKVDRERVLVLASLLRVADALDRGHHHVVKKVTVECNKKEVHIRLWVSAPAEMETWAALEKADMFKEVFARELRITVEPPVTPKEKRRSA